jgi:hypothetical protein
MPDTAPALDSHRLRAPDVPPPQLPRARAHFDHTPVISGPFDWPQAVTRACLSCHPTADQVMKTSHWLWLGEKTATPGRTGTARVGKRNLLNNFCIATRGNELYPAPACVAERATAAAPEELHWRLAYATGASLPSAWPELATSREFRVPCEDPASAHSGGEHGERWPAHAYAKRVKLQTRAAVKGGCG